MHEILENMKAQQIQVENLVAEMNMLRSQPDAREVAQRAIDATLHEVNQGRRLLSAVRLTKEQESEIRSQVGPLRRGDQTWHLGSKPKAETLRTGRVN